MALAVAAVAALLTLNGDKVTSAQIVLSAVAPVPLAVPDCADLLVGQTVSPERFAEAGRIAAAAAQPITDLRGSEQFRRDLVEILTARALAQAAQRARKEAV
jgi:carbon-monoxide dehydrogenase medium subunit